MDYDTGFDDADLSEPPRTVAFRAFGESPIRSPRSGPCQIAIAVFIGRNRGLL
jgi:hypothetical protein